MTERAVRQLLERTPVDREVEGRAWEVVRAAYAAREPVPRRPRLRLAVGVALAGAALAAAVLSPPGRAVVDAVRRSVGLEHAQPALFRLPAPGRLLVSGPGGAWLVAGDGSMRRLGAYRQAAWSPHGLFVVGATGDELTALDPSGRIHWQLARPGVRFPRWGGSLTDTRVAYLSGGRLHVVAGDGTGDARACGEPAAGRVAPAWRPGPRHVLAFVTARGRVTVLDTDTCTLLWRSAPYAPRPRLMTWSPDGSRLAVATAGGLWLVDGRTGAALGVSMPGIRALGYARDGRLAAIRRRSLVLVEPDGRTRTLFAGPAPLAGLAWSPNGRWLLTSMPAADQWVFVGAHRVLPVSNIRTQFGGPASLDGWAPGA